MKEPELEKTLSSLKRSPLPEAWKNQAIDKAMASSEPDVVPFEFSPIRVALGAIAACWVAIGVMHFTTPLVPEGEDLALRFGLPEEKAPLLVQHFATRFGIPESPTQ